MGAIVDVVGRVGGWTPAPGLTGEVEFTPWAMADRFEECQVVGSPLRLRILNEGSEAQWVVFWADSDVSSRRGTVKYARSHERLTGYDDEAGREKAKAAAKVAAVEELAKVPREIEFTPWETDRHELQCEAIIHDAVLRIWPAMTQDRRFEWQATSRAGAVLVGGQDCSVEESMVSSKNRTREVLAALPFHDDFTRLPDGKQRWTSRCGRACIEVWFDGTEWCYVAKAPGAATSNGMVTRCGSEHAAKMGGSTAAAVMLDRLDAEPPFAKSDATKPRAELLPPRALLAVSRVLTHGAAKYGHENHLRAGDGVENRYMGATLRHLLAHMSGEAADAETGESHLAHAAADLLLMLERGAAAKE